MDGGNHHINLLNLINTLLEIIYYSMSLYNHNLIRLVDSSRNFIRVMKWILSIIYESYCYFGGSF
jgi:hypothetical protein